MLSFPTRSLFITGCLVLLASASAFSATPLFDFENESDIAAWKIRNPKQDKLVQSRAFATSGEASMQFTSPPYKKGMGEWPAFEAVPAIKDWKAYDRLVVDVLNPSADPLKLGLFITDSKVTLQQGLSYSFQVPTLGMRRFTIPLSKFPKEVNRSDISRVHFFGTRPADMRLSLDSIQLLAPGETPPPIPASLGSALRSMKAPAMRDLKQHFERSSAELRKEFNAGELRPAAEERIAAVAARMKALNAALASCAEPEKLNDLHDQARSLGTTCDRAHSELSLIRDYKALGLPGKGMFVGFATSMEKILPKGMPSAISVSKSVSLSVARNEKESFQVVVMPEMAALEGVEVQVSDLKGPGGAVLAKTQIDCDVMGYVKTEKAPPYDVPYIGWWPDPILDFLGPVDIARGDLQSFWIRVRAPKGQAPGAYHGRITVTAQNAGPVEFGVDVTVHAFTLPDCTPLPTAITFTPERAAERTSGDWDVMKYRYADFLADYYIDYDSLYRREGPDFAVLKYLHDQGRLTAFNFGYYGRSSSAIIERHQGSYEKAKALGILDHAYIYGFDECKKERFPELEKAAADFKKAFPEVLVMTTSYDNSYGLDTCVKSMDAWCPLTPRFDPEQAAKARANGKKVWWYICCGPHHPHANWFVEYRAIEIRLLMGVMTAKYRPDGFLYYALNIWNKNKPITSGPYTEWNPVSWTTYHGDGSIFCVGPGGAPLPTIRLENYRDGLEDYAYSCILEEIVKEYRAKGDGLTGKERAWLAKAIQALEVPETLVAARNQYSDDPAVLYAYRERLGELIDASGMTGADPWGTDFGVRGFASK